MFPWERIAGKTQASNFAWVAPVPLRIISSPAPFPSARATAKVRVSISAIVIANYIAFN